MARFLVQAGTVDGKRFDMVFEDGNGAFVALKNNRGGYNPLLDNDEEYVPAPQGWQNTIIEKQDDDKFSGRGDQVVLISE